MGILKWKSLVFSVLTIWCLWTGARPLQAQSWSNGYGYRRPITIDHTKVPNSDQSNFPVLFSGTYSYLATTGNSGNVKSANGYDIIFTSDDAGTSTLAFEEEGYNASTGAVSFWVKIPTLSHTSDTVFYMFYGNSSVTTDQSNKTGVWDSNYKAVWHVADNASNTTVSDSTSTGSTGTNAANTSTKTTTGRISGALSYNGTSDYTHAAYSSNLNPSQVTVEGWAYVTGGTGNYRALVSSRDGSGSNSRGYIIYASSSNYWDFWTGNGGSGWDQLSSASAVSLNTWTHVVATYDGTNSKIYINGVQKASATKTYNVNTAKEVRLGAGANESSPPQFYLPGNIDEVRISNTARSADWIATEYNNQNSPAAFYRIGGSNGYSYRRTITIDHTKVPNSDQSNFPVLFSGTYSYLATTGNGGNVTSANGYDIIFTSDEAGAEPLSFERESYDASTGAVNFWVKVPTVSHSSDTVFYMFYGNSSVTAEQSDQRGVWDSNYKGVWHLPNGSALSGNDSTSSANNGTLINSPTATTGEVSGGMQVNGQSTSTSYLDLGNSSSLQSGGNITVSAWIKTSALNSSGYSAILSKETWSSSGFNLMDNGPSSSYVIFRVLPSSSGSCGTGQACIPRSAVNDGNWHYLVGVYDSSTIKLYLDGAVYDSRTATSFTANTANNLRVGSFTGDAGSSKLDEARFSSTARSADWIATEYNNQNSASTFYSMGSAVNPPTITSLSTSSGAAGTSVTITGTNFGSTQGSSTVAFNSTAATPTGWNSTSIVAPVPSGAAAGNGDVVVTVQGMPVGKAFTVIPTPTITTVTPTTGGAGTVVQISGSNFGSSQGSSTVTINGSSVGTASTWQAASITFTMPTGLSSGNLIVTVNGVNSSAISFTVLTDPTIYSAAPTTAGAGDVVQITGCNFGASQGSSTVKINGTSVGTASVWQQGYISFTMPTGLTSGNLAVTVGGVTSNTESFTVTPPTITSLSPTTGPPGLAVTIAGSYFGSSQGTVTFNGTAATVINSWTSTQVVAKVPSGATTGNVAVTVAGITSNGVSFTVLSLVQLTLTPSNPSIYKGATQQFTATGTYNDSSTGNVTSTVTWSSAAPPVGTVNSAGLLTAVADGTTTISATSGGVSSSTLATVATLVPNIGNVSPASGPAGTTVTITGSGFGSGQASGVVWLGSRTATVVSWSDTQIVGTVGYGSVSGTAQVRQNGAFSNAVAFTVNAATITSVSPTSGTTGTTVTISGSGFGSAQDTGQVWLGTSPGSVSTWSDGQVVATVAAGSDSGNAQILQDGTWSNTVAFTITGKPRITSITPTTGSSGTSVTIVGTGFGSSQGSGAAFVGSKAAGSVSTWSDTQVSATVASNAASGVVKIQQGGIWSNALTFTVPSGSQVTLNPNLINMVVADTRPIAALNAQGQSVTGLTWASSDTSIVTLSTDDPPIITAVAPGNATITAGSASADVTVYSGSTLPLGTVLWSNPGDGSGVGDILPAVPSVSGVDVFARQYDNSVQAVTSDGAVAWTASIPSNYNSLLPDFQGGLVVASDTSIFKMDGATGQANSSYEFTSHGSINAGGRANPAIHTDGTIFSIDYHCHNACPDDPDSDDGAWVVGINPSDGTEKFRVQAANNQDHGNDELEWHPWLQEPMMIAGDGYAYTTYLTWDNTTNTHESAAAQDPTVVAYWWDNYQWDFNVDSTSTTVYKLHLLRVGSDGSHSDIILHEWNQSASITMVDFGGPGGSIMTQAGPSVSIDSTQMITNADTGAVISWHWDQGDYCATTDKYHTCLNYVDGALEYHLTTTAGGGIASDAVWDAILPDQYGDVKPILQLEDGSFVGTAFDLTDNTTTMVAFDTSGNVKWTAPGFSPQMATADGNIIAADGSIFDANGKITDGLPSLPTYSWKGAYEYGSVISVALPLPTMAASYAAVPGGNPSGNGTSGIPNYIDVFWCGNGYGETGSCASFGGADIAWKYIPNVLQANFGSAVDFSAAHPDWVDTIQGSTLDALQKAFSKFPVTVERAAAHDTPFWQCIKHLQWPGCNRVLKVYVSGVWPGDGSTGETTGLTPLSFVYYWISLQNSQTALNSNPVYPPGSSSDTAAFSQLFKAVGTGLGNSTAHELGHQIAYSMNGLNMDCNSSSNPCAGGDNNVFELNGGSSWFYTHVFPQIHWQIQTNGSLCAINEFFDKGYREQTYQTCTVNLAK